MEKHDKTIEASSEEFLKNRIKELEKRLAFAAESNAKLIKENAKWQKWMQQNDANTQDVIAVKDDEISTYRDTIVELAVRAMGARNV